MPDDDGILRFFELRSMQRGPIVKGQIVTAAVLDCGLCGRTIDGMGGPGYGAVCSPCGEALIAGQLRGAVIYQEEGKEDV